jgi:hypothetical protein
MEIVHTQYRENYGTNEDPHWKNKGGNTYVLDSGVDVDAFCRAISYKSDHGHVFVIESYESDELPEHEEWDPPVFVTTALNGLFLCSRTTPNVDGTMFRSEIESKLALWKLNPDHEITEHEVTYTMETGEHLTGDERLREWYDLRNRMHFCSHMA